MSFAKLFDTDIGQVLVKIDSAQEERFEAEVRIYFEPKGFGVCNTAFSFSDWDAAEAAFELVDACKALEIVTPFIKQMCGLGEVT
jgi:hypothetical protein